MTKPGKNSKETSKYQSNTEDTKKKEEEIIKCFGPMEAFVKIKREMILLTVLLKLPHIYFLMTMIELIMMNANHIIPSFCHLPVICRSLVGRCGSSGSCKPHI